MSRRAGTWMARGGLLLGSTLLSLVLAELVLRALGIAPARFAHPWHLETEDKRVGLDVYPDDPRDYFPIDLRDEAERARWHARGLTEVDWRWERTPEAIGFEYSAELCRGGPIEPAGERQRVLAIGDSFTEGQGVREEDTFAARLGRAIEGAQVINCGRRGHDFPEIRTFFDRQLALEPDVVVYAMILNDPAQSEAFRARQAYLDDWILDRRRMFTEGDGALPGWEPRLVALIQDRLEGARVGAETTRWYQEMVGEANAAGWRETIAHVVHMRDAMHARGGRLVVALWPLMIELGPAYPFRETHAAIVRDLGAAGVEVIDTLPAFDGEDARALWVHPADRHPNDRAHAIFARTIEPAVRAAIDGGAS